MGMTSYQNVLFNIGTDYIGSIYSTKMVRHSKFEMISSIELFQS